MSVLETLFHLLPMPIELKTWEERSALAREPSLQLTSIANLESRGRLERGIESLTKERFEDFAFDWIRATEGRLPETQFDDRDKTTKQAYLRIASLRDCERRAYRPVSEIFPMVDFATSCIRWINAKSSKNNNSIEVGVPGAKKFLREFRHSIEEEGGLPTYFEELVKREAPTLVVLTNRGVEVKLSEEVDLVFYGERVKIRSVDLSKTGKSKADCFEELSDYAHTAELLKELNQEQVKYPFRPAKL